MNKVKTASDTGSAMNKYELIAALRQCIDVTADQEVLFAIPEADELPSGTCCLVVERVAVETAHDDDCTPFIRVYLIDPAFGGPE